MISSTVVSSASSLQLWTGRAARDRYEQVEEGTSSVLSEMGRISAAMSRDVMVRARQVVGYLRDDTLAVNAIKYRKFLVKTFLEQREREDFGLPDVAFALVTVLVFALSISTDMALAVCYYSTGDYWYFTLTLSALWIPLFIVNVLSLYWYNSADHACSVEPIILNKRKRYGISTAWGLCLLMHILLMGQIYRSVVQLYYGMKAWQTDHSVNFVQLSELSEKVAPSGSSTPQPEVEIEIKEKAEEEIKEEVAEVQIEVTAESDYYAAYIHQDRDLTTLDIIDGFLHDGTQIILQMYILTKCKHGNPTLPPTSVEPFFSSTSFEPFFSSTSFEPFFSSTSQSPTTPAVRADDLLPTEMMSVLSMVISLIILSWTYAKYVRAARLHNSNKRKINLLGMCSQFIWHMYTLLPRVTALAFLAAAYGPVPLLYAGGAHWLIMSLWTRWQRSRPSPDKPKGYRLTLIEVMATLVIGYINVFSFFKVRDEPTRTKYLLYYSLLFVEDTIFLSLWYVVEKEPEACISNKLVTSPLITLVSLTAMYLVGVFYLILYYRCCHPNGRRRPSFSTCPTPSPPSENERQDLPGT